MKCSRAVISAFILLCAMPMFAVDVPLRNWTVPSTWTNPDRVSAMADISNASIFFAVTPCRVADTRNAAGPYGGPILAGGSSRTWSIASSPCAGIPSGGVAAFSLNLTVVQPVASGFITAYPAGGAVPGSATIAWETANTIRSNDAIVPAASSAISVYAGVTTHLVIDINGYYMDGFEMNPGRRLHLYGRTTGELFFIWNQNNTATSKYATSVHVYRDGGMPGVPALLADVVSSSGTSLALLAENATTDTGSATISAKSGTAATGAGLGNHAGNVALLADSDGSGFPMGVLGRATYYGIMGLRTDAAGAVQTRGILGSSGNDGVFSSDDITAIGTKSFVEPHPTESGKVIRYVALEGGEAGTYFRGRGRFRGGMAVIEVPDDFRFVSLEEGLTVQVTPIGQLGVTVAVQDLSLNRIMVRSTKDVEFFYTVNGVRNSHPHIPVIADDLTYFIPQTAEDKLDNITSNEVLKQRLIDNGTYNPDGTVNMKNAEIRGWVARWQEQAAKREEYIRNYKAEDPLKRETGAQ